MLASVTSPEAYVAFLRGGGGACACGAPPPPQGVQRPTARGPPSGLLRCTHCARCACAACGIALADPTSLLLPPPAKHARTAAASGDAAAPDEPRAPPGAAEHAQACPLRFVHAVAHAVERLRRIVVGTEEAALLSRMLLATATATVSARLAADLQTAATIMKAAAAGSMAAAPHAAAVSLAQPPLTGEGGLLELVASLLRGAPAGTAAAEAAAAATQAAGGLDASAAAAAAAAQEMQPHRAVISEALGEGFLDELVQSIFEQRGECADACDEDDEGDEEGDDDEGGTSARVKEMLRRARAELRAKAVLAGLGRLTRALPRELHGTLTSRGGMLALVTDRASAHPLLLPLLLGPGFGDGLAPAAPPPDAAHSGAKRARSGDEVVPLPPSLPPPPPPPQLFTASPAAAATDVPHDLSTALVAAAATTASGSGSAPGSASASGAGAGAGAGDGLRGPSVWFAVCAPLLRTSFLEVTAAEQPRAALATVLGLLDALAANGALALALLYTPPSSPTPTGADGHGTAAAAASGGDGAGAGASSSSSSSSSGGGGGGGGTSTAPSSSWRPPPVERVLGKQSPPEASLAGLLRVLATQASGYEHNMRSAAAHSVRPARATADPATPPELDATSRVARAVCATAARVASSLEVHWKLRVEAASRPSCTEDASCITVAAPLSAPAAMTSSTASTTVDKLVDPCVVGAAGRGRLGRAAAPPPPSSSSSVAVAHPALISYTPSAAAEREYVRLLRDEEAFECMDGLQQEHALAPRESVGPGAGGAAKKPPPTPAYVAGGAKRLMRVSAELAALPSLAVHWASSILARQDSASMDVLRVAITGPAGASWRPPGGGAGLRSLPPLAHRLGASASRQGSL